MSLDTIWNMAIVHAKEIDEEETLDKDPHMVIVGSKNAGKSTTCHRFVEKVDYLRPTTALDYTFARRSKSLDMDKDVCHIWELGGGSIFKNLLAVPIAKKNMLNLSLILVLDLSVPEEMWITLETLTRALEKQIYKVLNQSDDDSLKQEINDRIKARMEIMKEKPDTPFVLPLLILGTKFDLFQEMESENRKFICKCLRYFALYHGVMLQFVSYLAENQTNKTRVTLSHMVFKTAANKTANLDYNKPLFVPLGSDSSELIGPLPNPRNSSQEIRVKSLDMVKECFVSAFPQVGDSNMIPEDPGSHPKFTEQSVDVLRSQKFEEMESYRKSKDEKYLN